MTLTAIGRGYNFHAEQSKDKTGDTVSYIFFNCPTSDWSPKRFLLSISSSQKHGHKKLQSVIKFSNRDGSDFIHFMVWPSGNIVYTLQYHFFSRGTAGGGVGHASLIASLAPTPTELNSYKCHKLIKRE